MDKAGQVPNITITTFSFYERNCVSIDLPVMFLIFFGHYPSSLSQVSLERFPGNSFLLLLHLLFCFVFVLFFLLVLCQLYELETSN